MQAELVRMVVLASSLLLLLAASVVPQRKFRLFDALFTDCGRLYRGGQGQDQSKSEGGREERRGAGRTKEEW
jgi:hypothetical protein